MKEVWEEKYESHDGEVAHHLCAIKKNEGTTAFEDWSDEFAKGLSSGFMVRCGEAMQKEKCEDGENREEENEGMAIKDCYHMDEGEL